MLAHSIHSQAAALRATEVHIHGKLKWPKSKITSPCFNWTHNVGQDFGEPGQGHGSVQGRLQDGILAGVRDGL